MRLARVFLAAALFAASFAANAIPYTWIDTIDFNPDKYIGHGQTFGYTHNITDDGFTPLTDVVLGYYVSVDLYDDGDWWGEAAKVDLPGSTGDTTYFSLSGSEFGGWSIAGWLQLNLTGLLDVAITSWYGDFYLGSSTLTAWGWDHDGYTVPEPGTVGLLGLAVFGAGFVARRKLKS